MSLATAALRLVTFGDQEERFWGGVLDAGGGPVCVLGVGDDCLRFPAGALNLDSDSDTWTLSGEAIALSITGASAGTDAGSVELGTASGSITVNGTSFEVGCPATRSVDPQPGIDRLGSLRAVSAWFGPELALSLRALRPAKRRDHAGDVMQATLFEPDGPRLADEARLSTTVGENDHLVRTSLELWIGEGDDLYPRRAAGESAGPGIRLTGAGVEIAGVPLRCHAAGLDGTGVYLLGRFS